MGKSLCGGRGRSFSKVGGFYPMPKFFGIRVFTEGECPGPGAAA